jgi:hypothetical protein
MRNTLGTASVLIASMLISSVFPHRPVRHEGPITVFIAVTARMTARLPCAVYTFTI